MVEEEDYLLNYEGSCPSACRRGSVHINQDEKSLKLDQSSLIFKKPHQGPLKKDSLKDVAHGLLGVTA